MGELITYTSHSASARVPPCYGRYPTALLPANHLNAATAGRLIGDDAGRLITTTVAGDVTRVYGYSQDGDLVSADVDGLLTTFAYS